MRCLRRHGAFLPCRPHSADRQPRARRAHRAQMYERRSRENVRPATGQAHGAADWRLARRTHHERERARQPAAYQGADRRAVYLADGQILQRRNQRRDEPPRQTRQPLFLRLYLRHGYGLRRRRPRYLASRRGQHLRVLPAGQARDPRALAQRIGRPSDKKRIGTRAKGRRHLCARRQRPPHAAAAGYQYGER